MNLISKYSAYQTEMLLAGRVERAGFSCFCWPRERIDLAYQSPSGVHGLSLLMKAEGSLQSGYKLRLPLSPSGCHATPRETPSATETSEIQSGSMAWIADRYPCNPKQPCKLWQDCSSFLHVPINFLSVFVNAKVNK